MLIESIQVNAGELQRLGHHRERIARSMRAIYDSDRTIDFTPMIKKAATLKSGRHKLRIEYDNSYVRYAITPYRLPKISSLKLVRSSNMRYAFKFSDRNNLNNLYELRDKADDILIINSGMVTDTWFCNVALLREGRWETPYMPLLHGTQRAALLGKEIITEAMITEADLQRYEKIRLFNAMIEWGEVELNRDQIVR